MQALWLTQIYDGTHLPSNLQEWEYSCNRLPRAVMGAPHLETPKVSTDRALSSLVYGKCPCSLQGSGTRWLLKVLSNTNHSVVLWFFSPASLFPRPEAECDVCRSEEQQIQEASNEVTLATQAKCGEIVVMVNLVKAAGRGRNFTAWFAVVGYFKYSGKCIDDPWFNN